MRGVLFTVLMVLAAIGIGVAIEATNGHTPSSPGEVVATLREPSLYLASTASCPGSIDGYLDVRNNRGEVTSRLVPRGPTAGLICRYGDVPTTGVGQPYTLVASRHLSGHLASEVADVIDAVSLSRPAGIAACPAAFAAASILVFSYRFDPTVDIWYNDTGCQSLDNGLLEASEIGNTTFFTGVVPLLARLAPRP